MQSIANLFKFTSRHMHNEIINRNKIDAPDNVGSLFSPLRGRNAFWHDSQFRTPNIQICICGSVNLHRYCAMHRARGNSANYSTSLSRILLSPEIARAPIQRSSSIKGKVTSSSVIFDLRCFVARFQEIQRNRHLRLMFGRNKEF